MSALRTFLAGTLAVATAEALVSSPAVAGQIGVAGQLVTDFIDRVVSPDTVAIGSADFVRPAPLSFDKSKPAKAQQPDAAGGGKKRHRVKTLRSTKARAPKVAPAPRTGQRRSTNN